MSSDASFVVNLLLTAVSVLWVSAVPNGYNYSQVVTHCHRSIKHAVTATGHLKTTVVSFVLDQGDTNRTERMECNIWAISSDITQSKLTVIINSLTIASEDVFFITSDQTERYDHNMTKQHDLFPKEVTSRLPIVLTWVRQVVEGNDVHPQKQRLAFSYIAVGGTDPTIEEKERVVLMGAIVISLFTVVATVLSITRSTKCSCCRGVCAFFKSFKKRSDDGTSRGTPTGDEHLRFAQADIRGGGSQEETVILMEMEVPRSGACSSSEVGDQDGRERTMLECERNDLLTNEFSHSSDADEEHDPSVAVRERGTGYYPQVNGNDTEHYVITIPPLGGGAHHSGQGHSRNDVARSRPTEPSLSELLGELPAYSPTPHVNVTASRSSPLAFVTSLLPSRLQRQRRPPSPSSAVTPGVFPGTLPLVYFPSSPGHPDIAAPRCGQVRFSIGGQQVPRASSGHQHPLDFSSGARQQGLDTETSLSDSPPPPYSDISPPAYSSLFPRSS